VRAFVEGVTAAAVGAITGAAFVLGRRAIVDVPTALVAAVTLTLLLMVKRIPEPALIVAAGWWACFSFEALAEDSDEDHEEVSSLAVALFPARCLYSCNFQVAMPC
jgi:chromate transport protein ChrA